MFGKNAITKKEKERDQQLKVNSIFYTIQGEGPNAGMPALFIRLSGCNLRCEFCDTEFETGILYWIDDLVKAVQEYNVKNYVQTPLVVITGGEPMLQADLPRFCMELLERGYQVQIETAGTVWQDGFDDPFLYDDPGLEFVCSPKTGKINPKLERRLTAYKYVIRHGQVDDIDGLPNVSPETGKEMKLHRPRNFKIPVYIMPCDEHDLELTKKNYELISKIAMEHGYRICLQMHKHLEVE